LRNSQSFAINLSGICRINEDLIFCFVSSCTLLSAYTSTSSHSSCQNQYYIFFPWKKRAKHKMLSCTLLLLWLMSMPLLLPLQPQQQPHHLIAVNVCAHDDITTLATVASTSNNFFTLIVKHLFPITMESMFHITKAPQFLIL